MGPESEVPLRPTREPDAPRPFFARLPGALAYPFRGMGVYLIVGGGLVFGFLRFIGSLPMPPPFGVFGFFLAMVVAAYMAAYQLHVIGASAGGEDSPPDWPDFSNFLDDILRPLFRIIATAIFSMLPVVLYVSWTIIRAGDDVPEPRSPLDVPRDPVLFVLLCAGVVYMPMGLMAVSLFESAGALNPMIVVPAIVKVAPAYAAALGMLLVTSALSTAIEVLLVEPIPLLGYLVGGVTSLYFLLVDMHVLGLIYHSYEERLGWFT